MFPNTKALKELKSEKQAGNAVVPETFSRRQWRVALVPLNVLVYRSCDSSGRLLCRNL
jgi:hypothetical protein